MTSLIKILIITTVIMILNSCTDVHQCCEYGCSLREFESCYY